MSRDTQRARRERVLERARVLHPDQPLVLEEREHMVELVVGGQSLWAASTTAGDPLNLMAQMLGAVRERNARRDTEVDIDELSGNALGRSEAEPQKQSRAHPLPGYRRAARLRPESVLVFQRRVPYSERELGLEVSVSVHPTLRVQVTDEHEVLLARGVWVADEVAWGAEPQGGLSRTAQLMLGEAVSDLLRIFRRGHISLHRWTANERTHRALFDDSE